MSYAVSDWVDTWGSRLLAGALVYIAIALMVSFSMVAAGQPAPPFLPGFVTKLVQGMYSTWASLSGRSFTVTNTSTIIALLNMVTQSMELLFTIIVTAALSYIYLSYALTNVLPYPLSLLSIPAWVAAVIATLILNIYLIRKTVQILKSLVPNLVLP